MAISNLGHRFTALDSMRGLCAIFVTIYHFSCDSSINELPFIKNGFLFVDFFFVLSGFVIAANYGDRLADRFSIMTFIFLRLGRLYPLHIFVLLLYLPIAILRPEIYSTQDFLITAFLLQIFTDGHLSNWNPPSWSISAEIWTYLVFAIVSYYASRFLTQISITIIAASPFLLMMFSDRYLDVCFAGSIFRSLFGFLLGTLCYRAWQVAPCPRYPNMFEVTSIAVSIFLVSVAGAGPLSFACPFVFATTIYFLANETGIISRALKIAPLVMIGELSYSIYMTHLFVQARMLNAIDVLLRHVNLPIRKEIGGQQTVSNAVGQIFAADTTVLIMIVTVILLSILSFNFVENPFRRASKAFFLKRLSPAT